MSSFICSDLHQFIVADFIISGVINETENPQQLTFDLANKLKRINVDSVNYRYGEKTKVYKVKLISTDYLTAASLSLHDKAKLAKSWIYQSCEDSSLDYFAYSTLIEQVIKASKANPELGAYWSI